MPETRFHKLAQHLLSANPKDNEFEIELEDQEVIEQLALEFESMGFWVERHGLKPRITVVKEPYRVS